MKNICKSVMIFTIIGLFIGAGFLPSIISEVTFSDQLDQYQLDHDWGSGSVLAAQSFKPTLNTLTRIEICIFIWNFV